MAGAPNTPLVAHASSKRRSGERAFAPASPNITFRFSIRSLCFFRNLRRYSKLSELVMESSGHSSLPLDASLQARAEFAEKHGFA
jgi:hypothetical protein